MWLSHVKELAMGKWGGDPVVLTRLRVNPPAALDIAGVARGEKPTADCMHLHTQGHGSCHSKDSSMPRSSSGRVTMDCQLDRL